MDPGEFGRFQRYDTPEFRALVKERGLIVTNSSSVYAAACAEHVFAFMLAQSRMLPQALRSQAANGAPEYFQLRADSVSLRGQSMVILGFGGIATELVKLLAPFEMNITAMRRHPRGDEGFPTVTERWLARGAGDGRPRHQHATGQCGIAAFRRRRAPRPNETRRDFPQHRPRHHGRSSRPAGRLALRPTRGGLARCHRPRATACRPSVAKRTELLHHAPHRRRPRERSGRHGASFSNKFPALPGRLALARPDHVSLLFQRFHHFDRLACVGVGNARPVSE